MVAFRHSSPHTVIPAQAGIPARRMAAAWNLAEVRLDGGNPRAQDGSGWLLTAIPAHYRHSYLQSSFRHQPESPSAALRR